MILPAILLLDIHSEKDFPDNFISLYHTHLYCYKGNATFLFNDELMTCHSGQFLFWFAESWLSGLKFSKGFKATVLLVEKNFLLDNIPDQSWSINAQLHSRMYPVKTEISMLDKAKILKNFKQLNERFLDKNQRFYDEVVKLQMKIFVFEMWHIFANEYEQRKHSLQTGTLYEGFIALLKEHCAKHREVQFYSSKLNITPKYLNYLSKIHSGMTASHWIQRYVREHIISLLQGNTLNISEIANEMEFSSSSFFTRYVKKVLGVTPNEYRARLDNNK